MGDGAGADCDEQPAVMSDATMQIRNNAEIKPGERMANLI